MGLIGPIGPNYFFLQGINIEKVHTSQLVPFLKCIFFVLGILNLIALVCCTYNFKKHV